MDSFESLYEVVLKRNLQKQEGSYTCYLFEQGIDKILKKCAEECGEVVIAAKNGDNIDTSNEICDLLYHLIVLMVNEGIDINDISEILRERAQKIGNLKQFKQVEKNS